MRCLLVSLIKLNLCFANWHKKQTIARESEAACFLLQPPPVCLLSYRAHVSWIRTDGRYIYVLQGIKEYWILVGSFFSQSQTMNREKDTWLRHLPWAPDGKKRRTQVVSKKSIFYKGQYISQCFPLTHTGETTQCNRETISESDTEEIIGQVTSNKAKVPNLVRKSHACADTVKHRNNESLIEVMSTRKWHAQGVRKVLKT